MASDASPPRPDRTSMRPRPGARGAGAGVGGGGDGGFADEPFGDALCGPFGSAPKRERSDPFGLQPARQDNGLQPRNLGSYPDSELPVTWAELGNPLIDAAHPLLTVITQLRG